MVCDLIRESFVTKVRFWEDSDVEVPVHWYKVPKDREILPVPSFVADAAWYNENGYRSNMCLGFPPWQLGEMQDPDRRWDHRVGPQPWEKYTGHYCGTEGQWGGTMSFAKAEDFGYEGCCIPTPYTPGSWVVGGQPSVSGSLLMSGTSADVGLALMGGVPAVGGDLLFGGVDEPLSILLGGSPSAGGSILFGGGESVAGTLLSTAALAMAGGVVLNGHDVASGSLSLLGFDAAAGAFMWSLDVPFVEGPSLLLAGSTAETGHLLFGLGDAVSGGLVFSLHSPDEGLLILSGEGDEPTPPLSAPCQGVDFTGMTATITNRTGDCSCVPSPWSPLSTGTDMGLWANPGTCDDTLFSVGVACVDGQYAVTLGGSGNTATLVAFTASPFSVTWTISGPSLCGAGGGSFDFTVS